MILTKFKKVILLLLIFSQVVNGWNLDERERMRRGSRTSCKASLMTVIIRAGCPTDPQTYKQRKRILSCESVHQDCTEPANFRYHCVLNEYANQSVEVCAPATNIVGNVCAEFNKGGEFVQEHYTTPVPCSRCPFMYISSDAYQYEECYKNLKSVTVTTSTSSSLEESDIKTIHSTMSPSTFSPLPDQEKARTLMWILVPTILSVIMIAVILVTLIIWFKRRHSNRHHGHTSEETVTFEMEQGTISAVS